METINLYNKFSRFVALRKDVTEMKEQILKDKLSAVVFNFDKIELISRSAAHEFILLKKELSLKQIEIIFEKMCPKVKKMFEIVENSKAKKTKVVFKKISIKELTKDLIN